MHLKSNTRKVGVTRLSHVLLLFRYVTDFDYFNQYFGLRFVKYFSSPQISNKAFKIINEIQQQKSWARLIIPPLLALDFKSITYVLNRLILLAVLLCEVAQAKRRMTRSSRGYCRLVMHVKTDLYNCVSQ